MARVAEVLRFKDGGPSLEEARAAMLAAGEVPRGYTGRPAAAAPALAPEIEPAEVAPVAAEGFESELPGVPAALAPPSPEAAPALAAQPEPAPTQAAPAVPAPPAAPSLYRERIDTRDFVGEIRNDGKGAKPWVGEIKYKLNGNGPKPETFRAASQKELMKMLLEAKGHATLRVRTAVRREKLGRDLDKAWPLPEGLSADEFTKLPENAQRAMLRAIDAEQAQEFMAAHPEYHRTLENGKLLTKFLSDKSLPVTLRNLEFAFDELSEEGLLEARPLEEGVEEAPEPITESAQAVPVVSQVYAPPEAAAPPHQAAVAPAPAVVSTPPVPVASAVTVRKRASSGLQPGQTSTPSGGVGPEEGSGPRELSEAEARKLPMSELRRIVTADRGQRVGARRF